jgi:hypothetical protein
MMLAMQRDADNEIDAYLRSLPPAPDDWVARAEELPRFERAVTSLQGQPGRSTDDEALRTALRDAGLEPDERRLRTLSRLLELRG